VTIIEAIILGIIQGLTEFLPISSSGHLVLSQVILGIQIPGNDFEVLLHIGTLCSILVVFNNDIKNILFTLSSQKTQKFILMISVGTIPAVIVGLGFKDGIERLFDDIIVVGFALVFTGITLISSFYFKSGNKKNKQSNFAKLSIFQPNRYKFKKSCPLSIKGAPEIDYKNIKLLRKYMSENGKILTSRITNVSQKKQRELSLSIKRARNLALI